LVTFEIFVWNVQILFHLTTVLLQVSSVCDTLVWVVERDILDSLIFLGNLGSPYLDINGEHLDDPAIPQDIYQSVAMPWPGDNFKDCTPGNRNCHSFSFHFIDCDGLRPQLKSFSGQHSEFKTFNAFLLDG